MSCPLSLTRTTSQHKISHVTPLRLSPRTLLLKTFPLEPLEEIITDAVSRGPGRSPAPARPRAVPTLKGRPRPARIPDAALYPCHPSSSPGPPPRLLDLDRREDRGAQSKTTMRRAGPRLGPTRPRVLERDPSARRPGQGLWKAPGGGGGTAGERAGPRAPATCAPVVRAEDPNLRDVFNLSKKPPRPLWERSTHTSHASEPRSPLLTPAPVGGGGPGAPSGRPLSATLSPLHGRRRPRRPRAGAPLPSPAPGTNGRGLRRPSAGRSPCLGVRGRETDPGTWYPPWSFYGRTPPGANPACVD